MGIYISNISKPKESDSVLITFYDKYDIDLKTYNIKDINSLIEIDPEDEEAVLFLARMRKAMREGISLREFLDGERSE